MSTNAAAVTRKEQDKGKVAVTPKAKSTSTFQDRMESMLEEFDTNFVDEEEETERSARQDRADPIVSSNLFSTRPGPVRTQGEIVLHTRAGHRLFYGRRKDEANNVKPVIGLLRFSTNVNSLFKLAEQNDPYADAALLKIEEKLYMTERLVEECISSIEELLGSMGDLTITNVDSVEPVTLPVEFKTAYGFMGARLLGQYDKLVKLCLSARHVGLIFADDWGRLVGNTGSKIREVFWLSTSYRFAGVSRNDISANNEVARRAIAKYGELPQNVLNGTHRAKHAPLIVKQ